MVCKIKKRKVAKPKDKAVYNKYLRERGKANNEWLQGLKQSPCMDCKKSFPPVCMDFDHVRGEKLYNVGSMAYSTTSRDKILTEIAKCDLVCANCHRIRSYERKQFKSRD